MDFLENISLFLGAVSGYKQVVSLQMLRKT